MSTISESAELPAQAVPIGAIIALSLGALDFGLETSIVLPALPALGRHYGASLASLGWFATSFPVVAVAAVPLFGRLGDLAGKRRVLLVALAALATGSLVCAVAKSVGVAIAGRAIQGAGAAVPPLGLGIARDTFPRGRLPQAIGVLVASATFGGLIGFLFSGFLVDQFSAAAIFWFLCGFAVLLLLANVAWVAESPQRTKGYVDVAGALLLSAGLVALLLAISQGNRWGWSSGRILGLFAAAALMLTLFVAVERRVSEPMVDLAVVVRRPFANANLCAALFGCAFFLGPYVIPQIAASPAVSGYGLALSTTEIGLLLTPSCVAGVAAGWAAGRLVDRVGARMLVAVGALVGVASYVSLALDHGSVAALATGSAGTGISWGLILTGVYAVVMQGVTPGTSGVAPAMTVTTRITGTAVGTQAAFAVIAAAGTEGPFPAESGFTRVFLMGAIGAAATVVAAAFLPGRR